MRRWITHLSLLAMLAAGVFSAAPGVTAQDTEVLQVAIQLCTDASCEEFGDRVSDVTVTAYDADSNEPLASCTTAYQSQSGGCGMRIPVDAEYFLNWSPTPDGYTYFGSNIVADDGPGGAITLIPFVPNADVGLPVQVRAALCTDATCDDFGDFLYDFEIIAHDDDTNEVIDSCFTQLQSQTGGCALHVPGGTDYYLTWDDDAVPAGYGFYNVIDYDGPMGPVLHTLAFAPAGDQQVVHVRAATCADDTCADFASYLYDFEIIAYDSDTNAPLDSCFTQLQSQSGGCTLHTPDGADYYLGWSQEAVPTGYEYFGIIDSDGEMGPVVHTIAFTTPAPGEALSVNAATCTDATCSDFDDFFIDFRITAYDNNTGEPLDTCFTSNQSQFLGCVLHFPDGTDYLLGWNPDAVPDGYDLYDVIVYDGPMGPPVHTLAFIATDAGDD